MGHRIQIGGGRRLYGSASSVATLILLASAVPAACAGAADTFAPYATFPPSDLLADQAAILSRDFASVGSLRLADVDGDGRNELLCPGEVPCWRLRADEHRNPEGPRTSPVHVP